MASKKTKNPSQFPSKQDIRCGYCRVSMRGDRLPVHTREFHPGLPDKKLGEVQSRNIADMLKASLAKRSRGEKRAHEDSDSDGDNAGKRQRTGDHRKSTEAQLHVIETNSSESSTATGDTVSGASTSTTTRPTEDMDTTPVTTSSTSISDKLDKVLDKLSKLELKSGQTSKDAELAQVDFKKETEALQILLQASKSIPRLCELAGLTPHEDSNTLSCDVCSAAGSIKARAASGIFNYDFSSGLDFSKQSQPTNFSNLKRSVVRHVGVQAHINNLIKQNEDNEKIQKHRVLQQSVGVTLGKQSYRLLKYCRPFSDYETDLKLLSDAKVNIGNINHSRKFPSEMRPSFADAVDNRIKEYLSTPLEATRARPPVGIVADKLTTRRRTGQMYACLLFTPGMENLVSPVSLGVTSVKKHNGDAIAQDVADICHDYSINSDQLAGFGFDGQYFHLGVHNKLKDKLNLDENVQFTWDPAHLLQLADKDMRKDCPWIEETCKDIGAILAKFSFGKTFEQAIDKASDLGLDFKAPLWFSETRFAAYAHTVFANFINNYEVVRQVLEEVAESDDQRATDACSLLRRIRSIDFVVKLLICCDFYSITGTLSKVLQRVDYPVWSKLKAIEEYLQALHNFVHPSYQKHEANLQQCTFQNHPLLLSDVGINMPLRQTRSRAQDDDSDESEDLNIQPKLDRLLENANTCAVRMSTRVQERFTPEFCNKIKNMEKAASLWPILLRARTADNESSFLKSTEVKTMSDMHPAHTEELKNLCVNIYHNRNILADCTNENDVYHKVYSVPDLSLGASHVLQTIAKIFCSVPVESVVESMGSIIDKIRTTRGGSKTSTNRKDVKDISDELKVHWNGPHIAHCESLVKQALNIHFKSSAWHFMTFDVHAKLYKVSKVVDRINKTKHKLSFMC